MAKAERTIKPKRKCCKDSPRCKRCPVVCKRLVKQGLAYRNPDGSFALSVSLSKREFKSARS